MNRYICSLLNVKTEDYLLFGKKIYRLGELYRSGYNVPEGYAISINGFKRYCDFNNVNLENDINNSYRILNGNFPNELIEDLKHTWDALSIQKDEALIVRSSAIEEDRKQHSCAGIYDSIINIRSFNDLMIAVKKCWSSYFSDKALAYRKKEGLNCEGLGILIQKMVEGDKSGVLFTQSPLQDNADTMFIETYPGLNFAVVDGMVSADRFMVDRQGNIINKDIFLKKVYYKLGQYSFCIDAVNIDTDERENPTLYHNEIMHLVQIGIQLEKIFNMPCDIEWTIKRDTVYILQARPISRKLNVGNINPIYFDNDIDDDVECTLLDRYSEPASTCYLSLLHKWEDLVYLSFYTKTEGRYCKNKPLMFYFNRVYWSIKYQREYFEDLPFNTGGFKGLIKKSKIIHLMLTAYSKWYGKIKKYDNHIKQYSNYDLNRMDLSQLETLLKNVINVFCNFLGKDHFRLLGLAQVCYNLLVKKLVPLPASTEIISKILELNTSKNMTILSNNELMELANEVNQCEEIREIFLTEKSENIYNLLKGSQVKDNFRKKFDEFIIRHGHRGTSCDDLYTPHWAEDTSIVLEIIKQFISVESDEIFKNNHSKQAKDLEYLEVIMKYINAQNIPKRVLERIQIFTLIRLTCEYMVLRENQRYYFDKSWILIRKILLRIGEIIVQHGLISKREDIFHLTIDEIYSFCSSNSDVFSVNWKETIERRKKAFEKNKKISPPCLIKNCDLLHLQKKGAKKSYKAIGISAGKAVGPVRLISSLKDISSVKQGEIAVVATFHPSWTPILCMVSGLVMNYGNILSHGAVVAREYGIPVVVFNDDATQVFSEGQWIEIDGTTGRIRIIDTGINPAACN